MNSEDTVYLATRLSLYLGLLLIGMAAGLHISLMVVQSAVFTDPTTPLRLQAPDLYPVLKNIQSAVATTGILGAGGLILGGVLDAYQTEVTTWISSQ